MTPMEPENLLAPLRWRYAVKTFDPGRRIAPVIWDALEQALVLTPSSFGLQPWHFLVITDRGLRESLMPHAWGQRQVVDCSHFVVFCIRSRLGEPDIDRHVRRTSEVRGTTIEKLSGFRRIMMESLLEGGLPVGVDEWSARQVYIALGNFMTAAALLGVDTCPMEGFEPARFDEILGLGPRGLASAVACAAGYRSPDDRHAALPKVRFPAEQVIERR